MTRKPQQINTKKTITKQKVWISYIWRKHHQKDRSILHSKVLQIISIELFSRGCQGARSTEEFSAFRENHQEAAVTNVIIHVVTNHLPRDHPNDITKISKLLLHSTKRFPNTSIYFSVILLKFNNIFFEMINHMNSEMFELCSYYHQLRFIQHQDKPKITKWAKSFSGKIWSVQVKTVYGNWQEILSNT